MKEEIALIKKAQKQKSVFEFAKSLHLIVTYDMIEDFGLFYKEDFLIILNKSIEESKFAEYVLAHELAHYFQGLAGKDFTELEKPSQMFLFECEAEVLSCYIMRKIYPRKKLNKYYTFSYMYGGYEDYFNELCEIQETKRVIKNVVKKIQPEILKIKHWIENIEYI